MIKCLTRQIIRHKNGKYNSHLRLKIFNLGFEMRVNTAKMEQVIITRIKLQKKFLKVVNNIESDFSLKWTVNKPDWWKSVRINHKQATFLWCFSWGTGVRNAPANTGNVGPIPESGRSPGEGNGSPLQCSCLRNSMKREAWWATVHGVTENWTRLSD